MGTPKGPMSVNRVTYETKDGTTWNATVLSYTMKEAIEFLQKKVPGWSKFTATQMMGNIDAVTDTIKNDYFTTTTKVEVIESVVPKRTQPEPSAEEVTERLPQCPWCEKEFKSKQTLGTHIRKFHMDTKETE